MLFGIKTFKFRLDKPYIFFSKDFRKLKINKVNPKAVIIPADKNIQ